MGAHERRPITPHTVPESGFSTKETAPLLLVHTGHGVHCAVTKGESHKFQHNLFFGRAFLKNRPESTSARPRKRHLRVGDGERGKNHIEAGFSTNFYSHGLSIMRLLQHGWRYDLCSMIFVSAIRVGCMGWSTAHGVCAGGRKCAAHT